MGRREDVACSAQGDETSAEEDKDGEDEVVDLFGVVNCCIGGLTREFR